MLADTSHRDAMAVAATVPNQLEMDRQRLGFYWSMSSNAERPAKV
jgi:hypothetical protein